MASGSETCSAWYPFLSIAHTFCFYGVISSSFLVDKAILKCILQCKKTSGKTFNNRGHWHCIHCSRVFERQHAMIVHLDSHFNVSVSGHERSATSANQNLDKARETIKEEPNKLMSSEGKYICPECSKCYPNTKGLQRHVRDQHKRKVEAVVGPGRHLYGICVDFDKGIFMISRTFSGIMHPIHCQHKTNVPYDSKPVTSSCEIDECMDAVRVARRKWTSGVRVYPLTECAVCSPS